MQAGAVEVAAALLRRVLELGDAVATAAASLAAALRALHRKRPASAAAGRGGSGHLAVRLSPTPPSSHVQGGPAGGGGGARRAGGAGSGAGKRGGGAASGSTAEEGEEEGEADSRPAGRWRGGGKRQRVAGGDAGGASATPFARGGGGMEVDGADEEEDDDEDEDEDERGARLRQAVVDAEVAVATLEREQFDSLLALHALCVADVRLVVRGVQAPGQLLLALHPFLKVRCRAERTCVPAQPGVTAHVTAVHGETTCAVPRAAVANRRVACSPSAGPPVWCVAAWSQYAPPQEEEAKARTRAAAERLLAACHCIEVHLLFLHHDHHEQRHPAAAPLHSREALPSPRAAHAARRARLPACLRRPACVQALVCKGLAGRALEARVVNELSRDLCHVITLHPFLVVRRPLTPPLPLPPRRHTHALLERHRQDVRIASRPPVGLWCSHLWRADGTVPMCVHACGGGGGVAQVVEGAVQCLCTLAGSSLAGADAAVGSLARLASTCHRMLDKDLRDRATGTAMQHAKHSK